MVNPIYIVAILLGAGFLLPVLTRFGTKFIGTVFLAALAFIAFVAGQWAYGFLFENLETVQIFTAGFRPPISINLQMGPEEAIFVSVINFLSLAGGIYLLRYFHSVGTRAFVLFLLMVLGLNGLVLTRDIFNVFVFIEITGIATYSLIGMDLNLKSLTAGFKYMLAGGIASVFLLLGIVILYANTGTLNIDGMIKFMPKIMALKIVAVALFMLFFSMLIEMKQFPANGWALDVYEATTPGVAGMISAAGTAAVFFALYKMMPLLNLKWYSVISGIGLLTFVFSNLMGIKQENSSRMLGYSSIAQMGLLLSAMAIGFGAGSYMETFKFIVLALFLNHFIAKAGLFWIAGIIKKDNYKEWGVIRKKPFLLFFFAVLLLGLTGFPPFPGFWGKWSLIMYLAGHKMFTTMWFILLGSFLEAVYLLRWFGYAVKGETTDSDDEKSLPEQTVPVAALTVSLIGLGYWFGMVVNNSVFNNFIPLFVALAFLLIDWLPAKIKGILAIAATTAYGYYILPSMGGYSLFFNSLFLGGSVILLIATLNRKGRDFGFYPLIMLMIGSLSSIVESQNILQLFFAWEIMTVSSYLLIMRGRYAREAALKYVLFSLGGAFSILAGFAYASVGANGVLNYVIFGMPGEYKALAFILVGLGFLVKAGALGLHVWVGDAYSKADDDVTPFISGLLSKAGIFGFIVLFAVMGIPKLAGMELTYWLGWIGALTAFAGTIIAVFQEDAKKLLAFSSMGQVGYIVLGMAAMNHLGWAAAFYHSVNHFLFKALLFLAIAGVIYRTGTSQMYKMGGLIKKMPLSFVSVMIGIIALSGVPPLTGFGGKWLLYEALIEKGWYLQTGLAFFASTIAFLYCFRLIHTIFLGQEKDEFRKVKEAPAWFIIPQYVLIVVIMVLSVFPKLILKPISEYVSVFVGSGLNWDNYTVFSSLGYWNATIIMIIVGTLFVLIWLFLVIKSPKVQKVKQFNIVFAGERPETPELTHFAYDFFMPYRRAIGFMITPLIRNFWYGITSWTYDIAELVRKIYTGNAQTYTFFILLSGIVLFFIVVGVN